MNQEFLKSIDDKVRQLVEGGSYDLEDVFNLGVELGRRLEKGNLDNIQLKIFEELGNQSKLDNDFRALRNKVCDWLELLVKASVKEHITESKFKNWTIGFNKLNVQDCVFEQNIVQKRHVQFLNFRRGDGEHFIAEFQLQGKLKSLFEKFNQPTFFEIIVDNDDGGDNVSITSEQQIHSLYGCTISYECTLNKQGVSDYQKFVNELNKSLLFLLLE